MLFLGSPIAFLGSIQVVFPNSLPFGFSRLLLLLPCPLLFLFGGSPNLLLLLLGYQSCVLFRLLNI
jgi:hypothetical protein